MDCGNVFVFNIYSEPISELRLNNQQSAGAIAAPSITSSPPLTPPQLAVARTNLTLEQIEWPLFVNGINYIQLVGSGQVRILEIEIPLPPSTPLQENLTLYLAWNFAMLISSAGRLLANVPINTKG